MNDAYYFSLVAFRFLMLAMIDSSTCSLMIQVHDFLYLSNATYSGEPFFDLLMYCWRESQSMYFANVLPTGFIATLLKNSFLILLTVDCDTNGRPYSTFIWNIVSYNI